MLEENFVQRPKKNQLFCFLRRRQTRIQPEIVLNNDSEVVLDETKATSHNSTSKSPLNRIRRNFSFCCSANAITTLSPIEKDELPIVRPKMRLQDNLQLDLDLLNYNPHSGPDENEITKNKNEVIFKRLSNGSHHQSEVLGKENVKINIQKPLEESKSRFRNRYLPACASQRIDNKNNYETTFASYNTRLEALNQPTQHFSNPDLIRMNTRPSRERK